MTRFRDLAVKAGLVVLGLSSILNAQTTTPDNGPVFCPPLDQYLTPTLLDVFIYPGITFR